MADKTNYENVFEYIDGLCERKQFKSEEEKLSFKQKLLETFKLHRILYEKALSHRELFSDRPIFGDERDTELHIEAWETDRKIEEAKVKTHNKLKELLSQVVEVEPGEISDDVMESAIVRMTAIEFLSNRQAVTLDDRFKVDEALRKAVKQAMAARKKANEKEENKDGQEPAD